MHFRKILNALLFALIAMCLVFSLVGCGDKAGGGDTDDTPAGGGNTNEEQTPPPPPPSTPKTGLFPVDAGLVAPEVIPDDVSGLGFITDSEKYSIVDLNEDENEGTGWKTADWKLGSHMDGSAATFAVYSKNATRILLEIYEQAYGEDAVFDCWMEKGEDNIWRAKVEGISANETMYAFRAWGPNWLFDEAWSRGGSDAGFINDYDQYGNRFNPNKVLFDPYARELSHDTNNPEMLALVGSSKNSVFTSGDTNRNEDSGKFIPKGYIISDTTGFGTKPEIPQEKSIIYEAHVRGITQHSSSANLGTILSGIDGFDEVENVPEDLRGTYAGAAYLAPYLKALGITTIELLPVHETENDGNPDNSPGGNYWGYMTFGYFAPDRRYSSDKSPGGPTKEFKEMVKAFHDAGLEVYLDVVYNHSGEGGSWYGDSSKSNFDQCKKINLMSYRGLDNQSWYSLVRTDRAFYYDSTGCGNNLQCDNEMVRNFIIDSLTYWIKEMGVDGFRFDLATVLGRELSGTDWNFNSNAQILKDIAKLGSDNNVEMIAEAWDAGGCYGVGQFPDGWGEWNGRFRDSLRGFVGNSSRGNFLDFMNGDYNNFNDQGGPHKSVNFVVAHDGFTLADLCAYEGSGNSKNSRLQWPFGPSDGGNGDYNNVKFGKNQENRRQAHRNYTLLQMFSRGTPMIVWGDEFCRTQNGNNNPYNIDSVATWSNYNMINTASPHAVSTDGNGTYDNNFGTFTNGNNVNGNFIFMQKVMNLRLSDPTFARTDYGVTYEFKKPSPKTIESDTTEILEDADNAVKVRITGSGVYDDYGNRGNDYLLLINMTSSDVDYTIPVSANEEWKLVIDTGLNAETSYNFYDVNESSNTDFDSSSLSSTKKVTQYTILVYKNFGTPTVASPVILSTPNLTDKTTEITLTCATDGATIYYSTDNNEPNTEYTGPFEVQNNTTVKTRATKIDFNDSSVVEKKFQYFDYTIHNINSWSDEYEIMIYAWNDTENKVAKPSINGNTASITIDIDAKNFLICAWEKGTYIDKYDFTSGWPNPTKQSQDAEFTNFVGIAPPPPTFGQEVATVYFHNTLNWSTVNAYAWYDDSQKNGSWPGVKMTKEDDNWWSLELDPTYYKIIFNNGSKQSADLTWSKDTPYFTPDSSIDKFTGTWSATK